VSIGVEVVVGGSGGAFGGISHIKYTHIVFIYIIWYGV